MFNINRCIFKCPIISASDIEAYYPAPTEEQIFLMSLQCEEGATRTQVFAYAKTNQKGQRYVEIDFYDEEKFYPATYKRFIIQKDCMMEEELEDEFVTLCREAALAVDYTVFVDLQESVFELIPDMPLRVYEPNEIGKYLLRVYFSTHRCGAREILYKANLQEIADALSEVDSYNLIGTSPSDILGVPTNLLRIVEQAGLVDRILTEADRERALEIYRKFSSHFGKKKLPNKFQWLYMENLYGKEETHLFNKVMYGRLEDCRDDYVYGYFKRYMELSQLLEKYNPCPKVPKAKGIFEAVQKQEKTALHFVDMEFKDYYIHLHNPRYEFSDDEFLIVTPLSVTEFVAEANYQDNCLISYVNRVVLGDSNIAFIRQKKAPSKPYVTMEICNCKIAQVRARYNDVPSGAVFEFVEKFARAYWISYDPYELIYSEEDGYDVLDEREDLRNYLEDFKLRNQLPTFPDDGITGEQVSLLQYWPNLAEVHCKSLAEVV